MAPEQQRKAKDSAREVKIGPQFIREVDSVTRTVTGIFSLLGNKDSYGDILWPGCFTKTIAERGKKILHFWSHTFWEPPIAVVLGLREVGRDDLPAEILAEFPEALGGAEVTRKYLKNDRANQIFENIDEGSPLQMSFGFDPIRFDYTEDPASEWGGMIRNVRELRLWETSDVNWGANSGTLASKMPLDLLLAQLETRVREVRAGARHSKRDVELLNAVHRAAVDLGCTECAGLADAETEAEEKQTPASRAEELKAAVLEMAAGRKSRAPVGVSGLWLRVCDGKAHLAAEIDGRWRLPVADLDIRADGALINRLVEVADLQAAPLDSLLETDADQRRAAKDDPLLALTLMRTRLWLLENA